MKRLIDYDPVTGTSVYHDYDPVTDLSQIETRFDAAVTQAVIERNKRLANKRGKDEAGIKKSWWHVASIPVAVQSHWLHEHGLNLYDCHQEKDSEATRRLRKLLNDPDWRYLKTTTGRV